MVLALIPGLAVNLMTYGDAGVIRTPLALKLVLISQLLMLMLPAVGLVVMLARTGWKRWPGVVTVLLLLPAVGGNAALMIFTNKDFIFGDTLVRSETSPDGTQKAHLYSGWGNCKVVLASGWDLAKRPVLNSDIFCTSGDGGQAQLTWLEDGGVTLSGERVTPFYFGPH